jgi:hypothetical protein
MSAEYDAALEIAAVLAPMSDYCERIAKALERLVTIDNGGRTDKAIAAVTLQELGERMSRVEMVAAQLACGPPPRSQREDPPLLPDPHAVSEDIDPASADAAMAKLDADDRFLTLLARRIEALEALAWDMYPDSAARHKVHSDDIVAVPPPAKAAKAKGGA